MKILIITSCTGEKRVTSPDGLKASDFWKGIDHVKQRESGLPLTPASELYCGEQHVRLMNGIEKFRKNGSVDLRILSAGYGLVYERQLLPPYEFTFSTMGSKDIRVWSTSLGIPEQFREAVGRRYDLALILLGEEYLKACGLDKPVEFSGPTVMFCSESAQRRLHLPENVRLVSLSNTEAKRFSCGLVGLKGELVNRLLLRMNGNEPLMENSFDILQYLESPSNVDRVICPTRSWTGTTVVPKVRYFIPEWDDLVDPNYDFSTDTHSSGSGNWSNEVYAHQLYREPNYDGILVSRSVAEKSRQKTERINAMGVHRYLRVPETFPVMGDCGAFDYINETDPPYSIEDILNYYTRLGFNYGASVDHMVVPAFKDQNQYRYDLTVHNAEIFLSEHRKAQLPWEPMGSVQGWDPQSYATAAKKYVAMGYKSLAIGSLVHSSTREIGLILERISQEIPKGINIHLFGIARADALNDFSYLGVTSVDSASPLRRAWLSARGNYTTLNGSSYAALRIPQSGKCFRAKRLLSSGVISYDDLLKLEQGCLESVRAFDTHKGGDIPSTVDLLIRYHTLINDGGPDMRQEYERTLTEMPWKHCACDICRTCGVEVLIFRGNNRNRRRGFHNTYVFYRTLERSFKLPRRVTDEFSLVA